jgi:hypothetical protein
VERLALLARADVLLEHAGDAPLLAELASMPRPSWSRLWTSGSVGARLGRRWNACRRPGDGPRSPPCSPARWPTPARSRSGAGCSPPAGPPPAMGPVARARSSPSRRAGERVVRTDRGAEVAEQSPGAADRRAAMPDGRRETPRPRHQGRAGGVVDPGGAR